ncbi:aldehyde dehydrogenase family protein [Nocardioides pantholopis]|uniref:aldehyde dehydrogenase family protein n=1 Tax=Nocardioides pantholopis TaxID=2483798 RepID=UPI000FDACFAF|nr:aldehyde dehydrogenase family protein [Nocardioides pantholopis]
MRIERENPARTDEVVGTVAVADADAVDAAVRRARSAQAAWADTDLAHRAELLRQGVARLREHLEELAELTARETGKVLADARGEAGFAATVLGFYADRGEALLTDGGYDDQRGRMVVRHRPFGVVAAVTPWNAPLILTMLKLAPALVAGNAVVVKPSPLAPFGVSRLLELVATGLPEGLVQVVHGGAETASALVAHPGVDRVAFTGGDAAGRAIAGLAARALTPSVLELGGNDPAVLLDDVELGEAAMERLVMATFATSGQVCMAVKRLYVHRSRLDEAVDAFCAAADRVLRLGDPLHAGSSAGPVVSGASAERVEGLVDEARAAGASVLPLGVVDPDTDLSRGYYVRPTLVLGAAEESRIVAEEQFGPTLPVLAFDSVEEVVSRANAGELGLGASVWSADEDRAFDVARRLEAGFAFVNTHNRTGMALHAPFGGVKRSGWGREYGDEGLMEYVQPCVVHAPAVFRAGAAGLAANAYPG